MDGGCRMENIWELQHVNLDNLPKGVIAQPVDNVNNPSHYKQGKYETIEIIDDIIGNEYSAYYVGNIVKYISRYKHKNGLEDLKKARWYLNRLIDRMEEV